MTTRFDDWEGDFLEHHGVKGQKWGIRRYQNTDGTLTEAGKQRYARIEHDRIARNNRKYERAINKYDKLADRASIKIQKDLADKYKRRAKVGAGLTAALAGATLFGANSPNKYVYRDSFEALRKRLGPQGAALKYSNYLEFANASNRFKKVTSEFMPEGRKAVTKILGAATVAAGGYTAYTAIRSKIAKSRTTEKGHAKAVSRGRDYLNKMFDEYGNTPYSDRLKEHVKKRPIGRS